MDIKINDIITLAAAGFNRDEIAKIVASAAAPVATPEVSAAPVTPPTPVSVTPERPAWVDDLLKSVDNISHTANIAGMSTEIKQETTDDILANIINPYGDNKGGINNGK